MSNPLNWLELPMKKAQFDLGKAAQDRAPGRAMVKARRVMAKNENMLHAPGVLGVWIGAKASRPYIMLAVNRRHSEGLRQTIPDSLDGIRVYYIEGKLTG